MKLSRTTTAMALALMAFGMPAFADMDAAKKFLDTEIGDMSTLDRAGQEAEMQWFVDAAKPYAGMEIKVVSETIGTHEYTRFESRIFTLRNPNVAVIHGTGAQLYVLTVIFVHINLAHLRHLIDFVEDDSFYHGIK